MLPRARSYTYEAAISSMPHAASSARELVGRLRDRLAISSAIWMREAGGPFEGVDPASAAEASIPAESARAVVVLHERGWGTASPAAIDRAEIERRLARDGPGFLCLVLMDDAPAPGWAVDAGATVIGETPGDECVAEIVRAIRDQGGRVPADSQESARARAEAAARCVRERGAFLGSHRSVAPCLREFETIADEITRRLVSLGEPVSLVKSQVQRAPGRCMIQLGEVALTLSWLPYGSAATSDGRLMIIQWAGTVRRGTDRTPERGWGQLGPASATVLREETLVADATAALEWRWRREGSALHWFTSRELAARCVDRLVAARHEHSAR